MNSFMNEDFMLKNETAKKLFHNYAEKMPLVDYHCHISPKEIYEDRRYNNLAEVWLGGRNDDGSYFGDHYKWRVMRSNAVPEDQVTGGADPYDKFVRFAEALEMAIGNPMYHWCNLELKKYFGINEPLTAENAKAIWDKANEMLLTDPSLSVRGIIRQSNVKYIGTTDDPVDTLEWHEKIAADPDIDFMVCPSFRPDKAINISKAGFKEYIISLAHSVGKDSLDSAEDVMISPSILFLMSVELITSRSTAAVRLTTELILFHLSFAASKKQMKSSQNPFVVKPSQLKRSRNTRRPFFFTLLASITRKISLWRFTTHAPVT